MGRLDTAGLAPDFAAGPAAGAVVPGGPRSTGSPQAVSVQRAADHADQERPDVRSLRTAAAKPTARAGDHCSAGTRPAGYPAHSTVSRTGSTPESPAQPSEESGMDERSSPDRNRPARWICGTRCLLPAIAGTAIFGLSTISTGLYTSPVAAKSVLIRCCQTTSRPPLWITRL